MASFTTRIELVNPDGNDYELLHLEMRDREFYRAINYCGVWHDLPPGEYDCTYSGTFDQIYSDAGAAAQAVINNKPLNDQQQPRVIISSLRKQRNADIYYPLQRIQLSCHPEHHSDILQEQPKAQTFAD